MGALDGLTVLDVSTLFAGPMAAMHLGDMGADVIKVEHPTRPDPARGHGPSKDGQNLWWKTLGRNKRTIALDLHTAGGREALLRRLAETADVVIENFRPGTLERWGLGLRRALRRRNPRLVLARVTGFGQIGPYRSRPGFGTLAEAMSGFAAMTGEPDGPPCCRRSVWPTGSRRWRRRTRSWSPCTPATASGVGQEVDVAIIEPILAMLGPQITRWDQLGTVQPRTGNRSANNAPRNTYRTADGSVGRRVDQRAVHRRAGHEAGRSARAHRRAVVRERAGRAEHADELDEAVGAWIAQRSRDEVIDAFERAQAAIAPIYDARTSWPIRSSTRSGPSTRSTTTTSATMRMQGPLFRLSATPPVIAFTGRAPGADTDAVLRGLGYDDEEIGRLRAEGSSRDRAADPCSTCPATGRTGWPRRSRRTPTS